LIKISKYISEHKRSIIINKLTKKKAQMAQATLFFSSGYGQAVASVLTLSAHLVSQGWMFGTALFSWIEPNDYAAFSGIDIEAVKAKAET
jgi:hypothetical protein